MDKRQYLTSEIKRLYDAMMTANRKMVAADLHSSEQKAEQQLYTHYRKQWLQAKSDLKQFELSEVEKP